MHQSRDRLHKVYCTDEKGAFGESATSAGLFEQSTGAWNLGTLEPTLAFRVVIRTIPARQTTFRLAGQYDNPMPTWFPVPKVVLKFQHRRKCRQVENAAVSAGIPTLHGARCNILSILILPFLTVMACVCICIVMWLLYFVFCRLYPSPQPHH